MSAPVAARPSRALWLPVLWYAVAASRPISRWFSPDSVEVAVLEGSPVDRAFWLVLFALGAIVLYRRKLDWGGIVRANAWVFALFALMAASLLWSHFPAVAGRRWVKAAGALAMALVVLTEPDRKEAVSALFRRCFYVLVPLSIALIKWYRPLGVSWGIDGSEMWVGVTTHKNVLGQMAMVSGLFFCWDLLRNRGKGSPLPDVAWLLMTLWLMNGPGYSRSNTSIFLFLVGLAMMGWLWMKRAPAEGREVERERGMGKHIAVGLALVLLAYVGAEAAAEAVSHGSLLSTSVEASGRDMTLSGRTELWTDLLSIGSRHPLLGVGYGSFWIGDLAHNLWDKYFWKPQQGHNGFIDVYVELGLLGLTIMAGVLWGAFRGLIGLFRRDFDLACLCLVLFAIIVVHNLTETSFLRADHSYWFLFLLAAMAPLSPADPA